MLMVFQEVLCGIIKRVYHVLNKMRFEDVILEKTIFTIEHMLIFLEELDFLKHMVMDI